MVRLCPACTRHQSVLKAFPSYHVVLWEKGQQAFGDCAGTRASRAQPPSCSEPVFCSRALGICPTRPRHHLVPIERFYLGYLDTVRSAFGWLHHSWIDVTCLPQSEVGELRRQDCSYAVRWHLQRLREGLDPLDRRVLLLYVLTRRALFLNTHHSADTAP